jgi:hypothetical protein
MVPTMGSARMHPVDPVHPVQNAGSLFPSAAVGWAPDGLQFESFGLIIGAIGIVITVIFSLSIGVIVIVETFSRSG